MFVALNIDVGNSKDAIRHSWPYCFISPNVSYKHCLIGLCFTTFWCDATKWGHAYTVMNWIKRIEQKHALYLVFTSGCISGECIFSWNYVHEENPLC